MKKNHNYGNESITSLKGADRVRLRPGVIFGSDGLEGCQHSFFEILSNSIDEAREGFGKEITIIRHSDFSITVEDKGRGVPIDYNPVEQRYIGNWYTVSCMQVGNMTTTVVKIMNLALDLMVLEPVQPSTVQSLCLLRCFVMVINTH